MTIFNYSKISKNKTYYIIAEIGVNHECSMQIAKKMILQAKKSGAHAAKFQFYKADKIASTASKAYWDTSKEKIKSQHELFLRYDKFNEVDYKILSNYCKKVKIDFLCTPFDLDSAEHLKKLVPAFKISSSDITNIPLLIKISSVGKPVILSTGASNVNEIKHAIKVLQSKKKVKIILMHCILNYPTKDVNANLLMIKHLKKEFKKFPIGYSDHTLPDENMLNISTAFILGANVIEKHFTLNKKKRGNDHYHSMDKNDLRNIINNLEKIKKITGKSKKKKFIKTELISRKNARRSIFAKNLIKKNTKIKQSDIITLRPSIGIPAEFWNKIINKRAKINILPGRSISWKSIK